MGGWLLDRVVARRLRLGVVATLTAAITGGCAGEEPSASSADWAVVCARGTTLEGIDVSSWQGTIDWRAVARAGKVFAIVRVGDGLYEDPRFDENWAGARAAGLIRGAYQYFRPGRDANAQADIMIRRMGTLGPGDLPPVLDVEATDGQPASVIIAKIRTWIARLRAATGRTPIIYTGKYFWNDNVGTTEFASNPLWIAQYGPTCPDLPRAWDDWVMWQYSSTGRVAGISGNVDLDRFNGTMEDLRRLAGARPEYAARFVAQSFPYASVGTLRLRPGESVPAYIEMRNTGTATWDSRTRLATTVPRDRSSPFAGDDWVGPNRPAAVTGTVPPGGTFRFEFTLHAPLTPGRYDEHFGMVQEGVAWFSDPDQGGPPDEQLEGIIEVLPPEPMMDAGGASEGGALDGGTGEGGTSDAGLRDGGTTDALDGGPPGEAMGGCGCSAPGSRKGTRGAALALVATALTTLRRPRRKKTA